MAFNNVTFVKGRGGLGRSLPGTDFISGLLFYTGATLPTGFDTNNRIKVVYSVQDAEDLGITNTSLGETKSTGTYTVSTKFTVADTFKLTCAIIESTSPIAADAAAGTVTLCNFTAVTADAVDLISSAARIAAEINLGTLTHGFTAVSDGISKVTFTAAPGQGVFLNTGTPYVVTKTGVIAGTLVQNVVVGVPSDIDILHYHISEFFRLQPKGKLWVSLQATADVGTFAKITDLQDFAVGEVKQLGIYYKSTAFTTAHCNTIQSVVTTLASNDKPISAVLVAGDLQGTADITTLTNLHLLSDPNVSVCIGQDGAAKGFKLFKATGKSITNMGETLGAVAYAKVNESIAWLSKFQVSTSELDIVAFSNGQLWTALSDSSKTNLDSYGYCFLTKKVGLSGTYHNRPYTAVTASSDYSFIHMNRTIDKAILSCRTILLPETGSPVKLNEDGTLTEDVIGYFEGLCKQALDVMVSNSELSDYGVIIDPAQDILATGVLTITVQLLPTATADFITVNIGFTDIITA